MKEIGSSELKFRRLAEVAKAVLVIPHSNASEERCLAWFAKTKHHFILVLGLIECCHQNWALKTHVKNLNPCTKAFLVDAKMATLEYNKAHSFKR